MDALRVTNDPDIDPYQTDPCPTLLQAEKRVCQTASRQKSNHDEDHPDLEPPWQFPVSAGAWDLGFVRRLVSL